MSVCELELSQQLLLPSGAQQPPGDHPGASRAPMPNLARRIWQVQEEERKRLSRELHDGVGQLLTALINQLQQLTADNVGTRRDALLELAREALGDTRELSRLMRPRILDDLGLPAALRWLVRVMQMQDKGRSSARSGAVPLEISLEMQLGAAPLGESLQILVFRVAQEALTNVVKHAGARRARLRVVRGAQALHLDISDDGCGFEPARDGFGLAALRDRVAAMGGRTDVHAIPGAGTHLQVRVPLLETAS